VVVVVVVVAVVVTMVVVAVVVVVGLILLSKYSVALHVGRVDSWDETKEVRLLLEVKTN